MRWAQRGSIGWSLSVERATESNPLRACRALGLFHCGVQLGFRNSIRYGNGKPLTVREQSSHPGGLSGSVEMEGAHFDIGGRSFHAPHPEIRELVANAVELYQQPRNARCFSHGSLIRYPFQKHFSRADGTGEAPDALE